MNTAPTGQATGGQQRGSGQGGGQHRGGGEGQQKQ
jgi:hypothetical protein